ncbi:siderophore-iron reductase FhuF [Lichenihabitans psoromatis]|uniref:siderophore-iron reductase FhuF n=1 Tax=Lichenihabitans psoromatis TaxID=2528642 RepID=UPI00103853C3|nr:siderophore-iron reductase FhuF [Lichenihabitans psoromatis]
MTSLDDVFVGDLAWLAERFVIGPAGTPAAEMLDSDRLSSCIDRFRRHHGVAERSAAASLWSQFYFSGLIVPSVMAGMALDRVLPLRIDDLRLDLCPESGVPLRFRMDRAADGKATPSIRATLAPMLEGHVAPMIEALRGITGLSRRLLWENAGWSLFWALGEAVRRAPPRQDEIDALLADPSWPDGGRALIAHMKSDMRQVGAVQARRVCCRRYLVPGFERCAAICPLADRPRQ